MYGLPLKERRQVQPEFCLVCGSGFSTYVDVIEISQFFIVKVIHGRRFHNVDFLLVSSREGEYQF